MTALTVVIQYFPNYIFFQNFNSKSLTPICSAIFPLLKHFKFKSLKVVSLVSKFSDVKLEVGKQLNLVKGMELVQGGSVPARSTQYSSPCFTRLI